MTEVECSAERARSVGRAISALRARFVAHERYQQLSHQFDLLLYRRRADIDADRYSESRGILVVGNSGSGKSTAIHRLFTRHADLRVSQQADPRADVISFMVPSPATLKSVGHGCLRALGYPLQRDKTGAIIWGLVQRHLRERQVLFLHLDEVQHLYVTRSTTEAQAVINTLKSLLQQPDWPVGLVLSGTGDLRTLVNLDPQLSRRLLPIEFAPISVATHADEVRNILHQYAKAVDVTVCPSTLENEFAGRLIHAAADELGLTIEIIIAAIEETLLTGAKDLGLESFRMAFRRRAGCRDHFNPFVVPDWRSVDARKLLEQSDAELLNPISASGRGR